MNIIVCTSLDLEIPCAAINRIEHLKNALEPLDVKIVTCGSSDSLTKNYHFKKDKIFFKKTNKYRFLPKSVKYNANAAIFYKKYLAKLISTLNIQGIIIYSMFSTLIEPITEIARESKIFVINDGGEKYSVNLQNIVNGINYMQYRAIFYSFKKLDGLMVCSPRWRKYAKSIGKPSIFFPSFMPKEDYSKADELKKINKNFNVIFMGSLSPREKPKTIFEAISLCNQLGYNFKLIVIGKQGFNFVQKISHNLIKIKFRNNKNIKFTGFISKTKKNNLLKSAGCFVLLRPSCKETFHLFPTRLPEYFQTKRPVVISKVEPFSIFYKHKKEVYFVNKNNNSKDLADAFIDLYNNPKLSKKIGINGKRYAEKNYSYDILGPRIKNFIDKIFLIKNLEIT